MAVRSRGGRAMVHDAPACSTAAACTSPSTANFAVTYADQPG
ncbi:hypothetical protein RB201_09475 [Streptomyces sp. S1A(2023)]